MGDGDVRVLLPRLLLGFESSNQSRWAWRQKWPALGGVLHLTLAKAGWPGPPLTPTSTVVWAKSVAAVAIPNPCWVKRTGIPITGASVELFQMRALTSYSVSASSAEDETGTPFSDSSMSGLSQVTPMPRPMR